MRLQAGSYHHHLPEKMRNTFFQAQVVNAFSWSIPHLWLFSLLGACCDRKMLFVLCFIHCRLQMCPSVFVNDSFSFSSSREKSANNKGLHTSPKQSQNANCSVGLLNTMVYLHQSFKAGISVIWLLSLSHTTQKEGPHLSCYFLPLCGLSFCYLTFCTIHIWMSHKSKQQVPNPLNIAHWGMMIFSISTEDDASWRAKRGNTSVIWITPS